MLVPQKYQTLAAIILCAALAVVVGFELSLVPFAAVSHIGEFLNSYAAAIGALATIAIACFTFTLKRSTDNLWKATADSIELANNEFNTTHRPRIKVRAISHPRIAKDVPVTFAVTVVNGGDNDATITATGIGALQHDGEAGYGIELYPAADPARIYLRSGARHTFDRTAKFGSEYGMWAAIDVGETTFIVMGEITYVDKMGIVRRTGFARELDSKLGRYSISKIYADAEYED